MTMYV